MMKISEEALKALLIVILGVASIAMIFVLDSLTTGLPLGENPFDRTTITITYGDGFVYVEGASLADRETGEIVAQSGQYASLAEHPAETLLVLVKHGDTLIEMPLQAFPDSGEYVIAGPGRVVEAPSVGELLATFLVPLVSFLVPSIIIIARL